MRIGFAALFGAAVCAASALGAAAAAQDVSEWRVVPPENLLVIDTTKGRVLVELAPEAAPQSVERVRTLAGQGFYDGLKFHRVMRNFMAQTGDPLGTGAGGSDLPDVPAEFAFRRGRQPAFAEIPTARPLQGGLREGLFGVMPVRSQPDAQMFVTADNRVDAGGLFCPGVAGMARSGDPNSANSQFFLMTGYNANLNGQYTAFGRVIAGLDVVESLKAGTEENNGAVDDPDLMTRARIAADLPEGERPSARVLDPRSPRVAELAAEARERLGARFSVCDVILPVEVD